jgi:hypothetical protein
MFFIKLFVLESSYKIQITFKRAYMRPVELSHKSQASVRWSQLRFILTYKLGWEDQCKLMRPNQQVGLYIYLSHRRNWIHTIASSNSKSLPWWLSCAICSENWIWSLPSCLTACILCHKYNHLSPISEVVRTILRLVSLYLTYLITGSSY